MKKYLIAGVVAVIAFAMAGFAATLSVDGGVIQVGSDDDLTCAEEANVASYRIDEGQSYGVRFELGNFDDCAPDTSVFVSVFDAAGDELAFTDRSAVVGDEGPNGLSINWNGGNLVDAEDIESVQVVLESN